MQNTKKSLLNNFVFKLIIANLILMTIGSFAILVGDIKIEDIIILNDYTDGVDCYLNVANEALMLKLLLIFNFIAVGVNWYKNNKKINIDICKDKSVEAAYLWFFVFGAPILVKYVFDSSVLVFLIEMFVVLVIGYQLSKSKLLNEDKVIEKTLFLFIIIRLFIETVYNSLAYLALLKFGENSSRFLDILGSSHNDMRLYIYNLSIFTLFGLCLYIGVKRNNLIGKIKYVQLIFPVNLVILLNNFATVNGENFVYKLPTQYILIILCIMVILFAINIFEIVRWGKDKSNELEKFILTPTVLLAGVLDSALVRIADISDVKHAAEEVILFHQTHNFGKELYTNLFPTSGLFYYVQGYLNHVIFEDKYLWINFLFNLQFVVIGLITIYLLSKLVNKFNLLVFVFIFYVPFSGIAVPIYMRFCLVLPSILILMQKNVRKNPYIWISIWPLLCFINILYYTLAGAAFSLTTLPIFIIQIYRIIKQEEKKKIFKSLIPFFIVVIIIFLNLDIFLNHLINTVMLGANATVRYGQGSTFIGKADGDFMIYLFAKPVRAAIFSIFRIFIAVIPIVFLLYIALGLKTKYYNKISLKDIKEKDWLFIFVSCSLIGFIIIYLYAAGMFGFGSKYINKPLYGYEILMLPIFVGLLLAEVASHNNKIVFKVAVYIGVICSIISLNQFSIAEPMFVERMEYVDEYSDDEDVKDKIYISVTEDNTMPNLGEGVMSLVLYEQLEKYEAINEKYGDEIWYETTHLYAYYILNREIPYSIPVQREYSTSEQASFYYRQNGNKLPEVIVNPEKQWPFYLKRIFSKNYVYERFNKDNIGVLHNELSYEEVEKRNKQYVEEYKLGKKEFDNFKFSMYGDNFEEIKDKFVYISNENVDKFYNDFIGVTYNNIDSENFAIEYKFDKPIDGLTHDYIYIDIDLENTIDTKNPKLKQFRDRTGLESDLYEEIKVSFAAEGEDYTDYRTVTGYYGYGKLLIPMSTSVNWSVSDISKIKIEFKQVGDGSTMTINDIGFYEYYPIEFDEQNEYPVYDFVNKIYN